jgi:hypothetical protein
MAPAGPEYRALSARRATEILVPPGAKSGRKAIAKLSDCGQRGLRTHPRRTNSKLGQTRRTRQAVVPDSESNTKGSVRCGLRGERGRLDSRSPKYRTGRRDSGSPPCQQISAAGGAKGTVNAPQRIFFVENGSLKDRSADFGKSNKSAIFGQHGSGATARPRSDSPVRSNGWNVL